MNRRKSIEPMNAELTSTISFLADQRAEARRRREPEVYAEFHVITGVQTDMSRFIVMPGLGIVPSHLMREALRSVPADAA